MNAPVEFDRDGVVVLARHGRTELNADGLMRGHLDPPLDEVGIVEANALSDAIAELLGDHRPIKIVTSPLQRARQTAAAIAAAFDVPIEVDQGLIDRDYGRWAGQRRAAVVARFGSVDEADGVEPATTVAERARHVLDAQRAILPAGPVVLVAHDAVNSQLLAALAPRLGTAEEIVQRTGCWNLLRSGEGGWQVELVDQKPVAPLPQHPGA